MALALLAGCIPPPAGSGVGKPANAPIADPVMDKATEMHKRTLDAIEKLEHGQAHVTLRNNEDVRAVTLGNLHMRAVAQRLDTISLWRDEEDKAADSAVWDGTIPEDVAAILPHLIVTKDEHVRQILRHIAMSAVYAPAGIEPMDYVRWRANVLAADKKFTEAARLLNVARIGRDSSADLLPRITFELASDQIESACLEAMASGHANDTAFWQGLQILCAHQTGDDSAVESLRAALPDGDIKTAAMRLGKNTDAKPLVAILVDTSGALPVPSPIADNTEILSGLKRLIADIKDTDTDADKDAIKTAARKNQGELLLLSLGALSAENKSENTTALTHQAFEWVKLN